MLTILVVFCRLPFSMVENPFFMAFRVAFGRLVAAAVAEAAL
jgi:hypothetical protein